MAAWVHNHGSKESNVSGGIEIPKRMPPDWVKLVKVNG